MPKNDLLIPLQHFFQIKCLTINMSNMAKNKKPDIEIVFRELVKTYGERIYNLALIKSNQVVLAEDICQETYIRAFKGLSRFRNEAELGTWIYRIALNVCHTMLKKESRFTQFGGSTDQRDDYEPVERDSDVQDIFSREESKLEVRRAISALPKLQSDAIALYYLQEFQYTEVATIMDIPINTVKSHLRRAKANLRELIPEDAR
mgnify:CR=1 FL=1